jgi:polyhydroxybutyrate depolymerase
VSRKGRIRALVEFRAFTHAEAGSSERIGTLLRMARGRAGGKTHRLRVSAPIVSLALLIATIVMLVTPISSASASASTTVSSVSRASPGCTDVSAPSGTQPLSFSADGETGSYLEQLPSNAASKRALPVIFDFHGYAESGQAEASFSRLSTYGRTHGFVTITPWIDDQAIPQWASNVGSQDTDWFGSLLTHIEGSSCIDENRVFVTGYSNGGFMALAVACQFSQRIAAAAPVAGLAVGPRCRPSRPVSLIAFQGTADPYLHYNGTPSQAAENLPAPNGSGETEGQYAKQFGANNPFKKGPTIPQQAAVWAKRIGCSIGETTTPVASKVALLSWSCPRGAEVYLYRIRGGGHAWPGSVGSAALRSAIGYTTFQISANALMWKFFRGHPLRSS